MSSLCFQVAFYRSVSVGAFVRGLSQISSFFTLYCKFIFCVYIFNAFGLAVLSYSPSSFVPVICQMVEFVVRVALNIHATFDG